MLLLLLLLIFDVAASMASQCHEQALKKITFVLPTNFTSIRHYGG